MKKLVFLILLTLQLILQTSQAKVALVIGNDAYRSEVFPELKQAIGDAEILAAKLKGLGFKVILKRDLNADAMRDAINEFHDALEENNDVGVFYYAGHGMQVKGSNYLIPIDSGIRTNYGAERRAVEAAEALDIMEAANTRIKIVVLDACRNNFLTARSGKRGLSAMSVGENTYIAYATTPDDVADDGIFMHYLAKWITEPLRIQEMFMRVKDDVLKATGKGQAPAFNDNLVDRFCFTGQCPSNLSFQPQLTVVTPEPKKAEAPIIPQAEIKPEPVYIKPVESRLAFEPEMVKIKGGRFMMGSFESEKGRYSDEKQHEVFVADFEIGKYEVTRGQFSRFIEETNYKTEAEKGDGCYGYKNGSWKKSQEYNWRNLGFPQTDNHPVACVSWNDAVAYTKWLSEKTGKAYRLPTEAQWEYAARAKTNTARFWGDLSSLACQYANVADKEAKTVLAGWTIHDCNDNYVYTSPVGSFKANDFALYDILGNVWEWTCSEYDENYNGKEQQCLSKNSANLRASLRGGSWNFYPSRVRSGNRNWGVRDGRLNFLGFRVSRIN